MFSDSFRRAIPDVSKGVVVAVFLLLLLPTGLFGVGAQPVQGLPGGVPQQAQGQGATVTGVGPWTEMNNYGSSTTAVGTGGILILGVSCVTYSGYVYCVGGQDLVSGTDISDVFYAKLSSSGSISAWTETTDYGATSGTSGSGGLGIEWPSCVESGGYIYCVGGATISNIVSKVYYAQLSTSGVGPWTETTDFGAASGSTGSGGISQFQLSCVTDSGYIYCVGAGSKVFFAQLSASGVGPWVETTDYGAASGTSGSGGVNIASVACVDDTGYIYCVGGTVAYKPSSDVFYAPVSSSGVGPWTESTDYGATSGSSGSGGEPIYGTSCVVDSPYVICIGGDTTGNSGTNHVYYGQDEAIAEWYETYDFETGYWFSCVQIYGYVFCWGDGSPYGYSAPIQPTTVAKVTPTITTSLSNTTIMEGQNVQDSATLSNTSPNAPASGNVTYSIFPNGHCGSPSDYNQTVTVSNGVVPSSDPIGSGFFATGPYSFQAFYGGDANNNPATSECEPLTVTPFAKSTPTLTTSLSSMTIAVGQNVQDTATLSNTSPIAPASGNVTYSVYLNGHCGGESSYNEQVTVANGLVPPSSSIGSGFFSAGPYSFQAVYSGDANNNPTTSECEPLTVTSVTKTTPSVATSLSNNTIMEGQNVEDSATLSNTSPNAPATGNVTYSIFPNGHCGGPSDYSQVVTVTNGAVPSSSSIGAGFFATGPYSFQATYSGDANNNPATSECEPLTVTPFSKANPNLTTSLSSKTVPQGGSVADSATLSDTSPVAPAGGNVTYYFYNSSNCSGSGYPVETVTVTNGNVPGTSQGFGEDATVGSVSYQAVYSGDANNNPATSECEPFAITAKSGATSTGPAQSSGSNIPLIGGAIAALALLVAVLYLLWSRGIIFGVGGTPSQATVAGGAPPTPPTITGPPPPPPPPDPAYAVPWEVRDALHVHKAATGYNPAKDPCREQEMAYQNAIAQYEAALETVRSWPYPSYADVGKFTADAEGLLNPAFAKVKEAEKNLQQCLNQQVSVDLPGEVQYKPSQAALASQDYGKATRDELVGYDIYNFLLHPIWNTYNFPINDAPPINPTPTPPPAPDPLLNSVMDTVTGTTMQMSVTEEQTFSPASYAPETSEEGGSGSTDGEKRVM